MGSFISKQPNGLYCRFSTVTDCPTHWNMTEDDYIKLCEDRARAEAKDVLENHLYPFEWVTDQFVDNNMSNEEFEEFLKEVRVSANMLTVEDKEIIETYAECDMNRTKTSEMLYLHSNTVVYHLNKIFKKTGLNPRKFYDLNRLLKIISNT